MPNFFEKVGQSPYLPSARTVLLTSLFLLLTTSLLMVMSASWPLTIKHSLPFMHYFWMQAIYIGLGIIAGYAAYRLPLKLYFNFTLLIGAWFVVAGLLALTYFIAEPINGSRRWLNLGVINIQSAELAKLLMIFVVSDYVVRRSGEVRQNMFSGWKLIIWYLPMLFWLLLHPDFGSVAVIVATASVILFISGVPKREFGLLMAAVSVLIGLAVWMADYRRARAVSFWNPFDDPQNSDYQLARSLSAFARGEFDGVGYGASVLKLSHLPEAHTDFLLSVTGEELGFFGVFFVLVLLACVVGAIMKISYNCLRRRQLRLSYVVFGFASVLFGQMAINAGMAMGLLPTKGLTLPFFSYGGSSLLSLMMMIGVVLKIDKSSAQIHQENKNREY